MLSIQVSSRLYCEWKCKKEFKDILTQVNVKINVEMTNVAILTSKWFQVATELRQHGGGTGRNCGECPRRVQDGV